MISELGMAILGDMAQHPLGVTPDELAFRLKRPMVEIENAMSQLKRLGHITQEKPGTWRRATATPVHTEREPDHARIVGNVPVDRGRSLGDFTPRAASWTSSESHPDERDESIEVTQERTMPRGKATRTCPRCEQAKGVTAFFAGDEICRACRKGGSEPKAAEPKKPPAKRRKPKARRVYKPRRGASKRGLKAIIERHVNKGRRGLSLCLDELRAERAKIDRAIATLEDLGIAA